MSFPVFIHIGPWRLHPHLAFELLAYTAGFQTYLWLRRRDGDPLSTEARWSVVAAAIVGAAVGARSLSWLEAPAMLVQHWRDPQFLLGGKTVVGGLVGGLISVELTKKLLHIALATGDLFAIPLAVGIAIGRVGCFLTGLQDGTYGTPTSLWTGVDFGDGIPRHPTQLYEIAFLLLLAAVLFRLRRAKALKRGGEFRIFMLGYLAFRLIADSIKPDPALALRLSSIQWVCAATLAYYVPGVVRWTQTWPAPAVDLIWPRSRAPKSS